MNRGGNHLGALLARFRKRAGHSVGCVVGPATAFRDAPILQVRVKFGRTADGSLVALYTLFATNPLLATMTHSG